MRTHTRSVVVRGITTALALALVVLLPGGAVADANPTAPRSGPRVAAEALLAEAQSVLTPKPKNARRAAAEPGRDFTLLLRDLGQALPSLNRSDRRAARRILARPTDPAGDCFDSTCSAGVKLAGNLATYSSSASSTFLIHYQASPPLIGPDQTATAAQAQKTAQILDQVFNAETGTLNFRRPIADTATASPGNANNPDGRFDVYLADTGTYGIYGYVSSDDPTSNPQVAPYLVLDNDFATQQFPGVPDNSLRVTAAHEFFHAIQFGYNADQETWAMEGSAVWAEDEVYPGINDYLQYLRYSPVAAPGTPIDSNGTYQRYGIVVFWKFLAEYLRDRRAVRSFWEYADAPAGRTALQAVTATLSARGHAFGPTVARFGAWNTLPSGSYADRSLWPAPVFSTKVVLRRSAPRMAARAFDLNHLTSTALLIRPAPRLPRARRLKVFVNGPSGATSPQALLQVRMRNGTVRYVPVPLNSAGDGNRIVPFNRRWVSAVVLTLSNASLNGADRQRFSVTARVVR